MMMEDYDHHHHAVWLVVMMMMTNVLLDLDPPCDDNGQKRSGIEEGLETTNQSP